jgi:hypothetical protein
MTTSSGDFANRASGRSRAQQLHHLSKTLAASRNAPRLAACGRIAGKDVFVEPCGIRNDANDCAPIVQSLQQLSSKAAACPSTPIGPRATAEIGKYAVEFVALSPDWSCATKLRRSLHVGFSRKRPKAAASRRAGLGRIADTTVDRESSKSGNGDL